MMADRVVITSVDLEHAVRSNAALESAGFETALATSVDEARQAILRREPIPDCLVLTGGLHEPSAAQLLVLARDRSVSTLGLVESTEPDPQGLARRLGLTAFLEKPADPAEVVATVRRLVERRRLQQRTGIIGESPAIQEMLVKIEQMAPVTSTVLIEGESGTGKELVARGIHDLSPRRGKPFVAVNCAAIPDMLLESELFGHEKGAFTGAAERRLGRFELADGGTIFLDEVGEMTPATQVKLLRVLEDRTFFRVGGTQPIKVDVRVIAATNKALKEQVALGRFRDDLFYRLAVLYIYLPPLRERRTDIPLLVRRFIAEIAATHDRQFRGITPEALQILVDADWPGNVRQLRNLIESMVVLAPEGEIRASDIPRDIRERGRGLPVRVPGAIRDVAGQELEFIFHSLVDLKLQIEELRRRIEERPQRVEVIEVGHGAPPLGPIDAELWVACLACGGVCPADAVAVEGQQVRIVDEACTRCGLCLPACPHDAIVAHGDLGRALELAQGGRATLILSVESAAYFYPDTPEQVVNACYAAGFRTVHRGVLGDELVAQEYLQLWSEDGWGTMIRSTCPVVVETIEHEYPELIPYLAPVATPVAAEARYLKRMYWARTPVVYAGVCLTEGGPDVDAAVTFEDLRQLLQRRGVGIAEQPLHFDRLPEERRRHLSTAGGLPLEVLMGETQASRRVRQKRGLGEAEAIGHAPGLGPNRPGFVGTPAGGGCPAHPLVWAPAPP